MNTTRNPFDADQGYDPVHPHDPITDPKTNIDEWATNARRNAEECASHATLFPRESVSRLYFLSQSRSMHARSIALLAAFYIEQELLRADGDLALIQKLLAELEAGTTNTDCRELREWVGL